MSSTVWVVLVFLAIIGATLWWLKQSPGGGRSSTDRADGSLEKLIGRLRGDRAQAERLIAYELGRNPAIGRQQAIVDAMARLERDPA